MDEEVFTCIMLIVFGILVIAMTQRIVKAVFEFFGINVNDKN